MVKIFVPARITARTKTCPCKDPRRGKCPRQKVYFIDFGICDVLTPPPSVNPLRSPPHGAHATTENTHTNLTLTYSKDNGGPHDNPYNETSGEKTNQLKFLTNSHYFTSGYTKNYKMHILAMNFAPTRTTDRP